MYFKLALRNVRKSYKDFLIYFLTLAFSVCLFYTFNSFQDQQSVMELTKSQSEIIELLTSIMTYLSIFVAVVLAFLILYANNFLIKRRKKELGLYMLMGMPKVNMSKVLIYETFIIGIISLITGILAGLFLSQILTTITANLFDVSLNYHFIFSYKATILTLLAFGVIFLIIMLCNTFVLNSYKLIDLIHADKAIEKLRIKQVKTSVLLFLISIDSLGYAYYLAISEGINSFAKLYVIIPLGCIGTFLFFMSLAGFLLIVMKSNKRFYFKNLHCFVLKQINANINTNYISMSIVCIMLLMSIGALATGLNLNQTINKGVRNTTPFDYSLSIQYTYPNGSERVSKDVTVDSFVEKADLPKDVIKNERIINVYYTNKMKINDPVFMKSVKDKHLKELLDMNFNSPIHAIKQSDFNVVMKNMNLPTIKLKNNETYLYTTLATFEEGIKDILQGNTKVNLFNNTLKVTNTSFESPSMYTTVNLGGEFMLFVVPDNEIPKDAKIYYQSWNIDFQEGADLKQLNDKLDNAIHPKDLSTNDIVKKIDGVDGYSKDYVKNSNKGYSVIFTYVGLYLGIVFMLSSGVILALQQLSQAGENKKQYQILNKIGAESKMMNRSILLQIGIYFMMPMMLAIIHSIVGIQVVNTVVNLFGKSDIFQASMFTAGIIVIVYGAYFMVTYWGYKNILRS